jgi:hypothetical protein
MEQQVETRDEPAPAGRPRLGVWGNNRGSASGEPGDPGLEWVAGLSDERASAELTMQDLLTIWRSAERRLEGMTDADGESSLIRAQIVAMRMAYQQLFAQIRLRLPAR